MTEERDRGANHLIDAGNAAADALDSQVAVVTGGGGGIGLETARVLAHLGARVGVLELSAAADEAVARIRADGGTACSVRVDIADPEALQGALDAVKAELEPVDILVNNAAVVTVKPLADHTLEEWDRVMAVNLRAAFVAVKAVLPSMVEHRRGTIVTMESAEGMPYLAPYLATKAAMRSLALSLGQELAGTAVAAYCFAPGIVDTPGLRQAFAELAPRLGASLEEFTEQSGLPRIAAQLSATGLAGTILHATQLSGQETDYMEGLRLLGLDADGRPARQQPAPDHALAVPAVHDLVEANEAVAALLAEHERELADIPVFARPIAQRVVKRATGLPLPDLRARVEEMTARLAPGAAADGEDVARYRDTLRGLLAYLQKQEADAPGWFKDENVLRTVLDGIRQRQFAVRAVIDGLD